MTSIVSVQGKFIVMVLTAVLCIVHCLASYGQGMPRIGPYDPLAHENEDPRFEVPQVRGVDCWTPVPPHWLVGVVRELPEVRGPRLVHRLIEPGSREREETVPEL